MWIEVEPIVSTTPIDATHRVTGFRTQSEPITGDAASVCFWLIIHGLDIAYEVLIIIFSTLLFMVHIVKCSCTS